MAEFDKWAGKKIRASQKMMKKAAKAAEAKKQGQSNANLGRQWGTNLSAQYDNDGNPPERPGTGGVKAPKKPKPKSPKDSAAAKVVQPTLF